MSELKVCPFCGGKAEIDAGRVWMSIFCSSCQISTQQYKKINESIKAWNTRKDDWVSVENEPAKGDCLVQLEPRHNEEPEMHVAKYHKNIVNIGNHFEFDMPKVTHWHPLPRPAPIGEDK